MNLNPCVKSVDMFNEKWKGSSILMSSLSLFLRNILFNETNIFIQNLELQITYFKLRFVCFFVIGIYIYMILYCHSTSSWWILVGLVFFSNEHWALVLLIQYTHDRKFWEKTFDIEFMCMCIVQYNMWVIYIYIYKSNQLHKLFCFLFFRIQKSSCRIRFLRSLQ